MNCNRCNVSLQDGSIFYQIGSSDRRRILVLCPACLNYFLDKGAIIDSSNVIWEINTAQTGDFTNSPFGSIARCVDEIDQHLMNIHRFYSLNAELLLKIAEAKNSLANFNALISFVSGRLANGNL